MKKRFIILLFMLFSVSWTVSAQTARLYTPENELINSQINRICQDARGTIWICTEGGLARFDGMGFETFRHDRENGNSIPSDSVHDLLEDSHGTKWVATAAGLAIFESDYNRFRHFDLQDARNASSNQFIDKVIEVPDRVSGSQIFVCTGGYGVYVIDPETKTLLNDKRERLYRNVHSEYITSLFLDENRHLWVVPNDNDPLVILDADSLEPATDLHWSADLAREAGRIRVTASAEDPITHNLLIGTAGHGLLVYETASRTLRRARGAGATGAVITAAVYDSQTGQEDGRGFLLGSENGGLLRFDIPTESLRPHNLPSIRQDNSDWKATTIFEDNQGNFWIGLYQTGVLVAPQSMFGFSYLGFSSQGLNGTNSACVMSIYEDGGRLWVGTDGAGLFCREGQSQRNYTRDNSALTNNAIMAVTGDRRGTVWVGTYLDGLFYLDPKTGLHKFADGGKIGSERIRTLAYDESRDLLYIGTYGAGLVVADAARKTVIGNVINDNNRWVSALHIDKDGLLWVGTYNGPQCYDPETGQLVSYNILPDGSPLRIYAICSEPDGTMWFGTGEGAFRVEAGSREVRQYTEKDGLANNVIRDILRTNAGDLWFSTANGLSRLSPKTAAITNYHVSDGLQGNEFRSGAAFRSPTGKLYFGGTSGVTAFSPLLVDSGAHKVPQVSLSRLRLLDRQIDYDPAPGSVNYIDKHISQASKIEVPNNVDLFSVEFSVPEYTNPQRIVYAYRLRGFDSDWKTVPARLRTATYTNVPPGRYQLEVKAFFEGTPDDFSERSVSLHVEAPWYRKGGAYVFYLILLAGLALLLGNMVRQRRRRAEEKKDAELKELRLGLFTNLTHEIRTPLTLVMGPLRTLRETEQDPAQKDTYNLMYRNCLRINRLVDQLMDIRKIDAGQMPMHFRQTDLIYFIKDIMRSFLDLARTKKVNFTLNSANDEQTMWIDQGNFDKVIYNILSNAFKHTPDGGRIRVDVSAPTENRNELRSDIKEYIKIDIFNSGSRIEEAYISRIFDRFVQVDPYDANSGSGVGLNLTKLLVELHHGQISAENQEDGVVFHVLVPVGKEHLTEGELSATSRHKDLYVKGPEIRLDDHEDETFAQQRAEEDKTVRTRRNLMVVEDDAETREYLRGLLRGSYNVTVCSDGQEAWPLVTTSLPDAVITDLVMPGMSGSELCAKIRQNPATNHIPVIILTGQDGEQEQQNAVDSGADKFLSKPVSVALLLSSIAQVISARDAVRGKFGAGMEFDYSGIKMGSADEKLMRRIVESIQTHLEDPEFDVAALCLDVGISRVHLNRKLKENGNVPPSVLIKSFRMKQAAYLLANNKVNVSEVAYRVGFASHSYFSSSFRDFFGMTPRDFVARFSDNPDDEQLKKLFE
ncbi:MAG: response regulator [Bacteroidales bacterium]|nr:response regulator [Bacteroidales bacterium]